MDTQLVPRSPSDIERRELLMQALNVLGRDIKREIEDAEASELPNLEEIDQAHKDLEHIEYLQNELRDGLRYKVDDIEQIYEMNHFHSWKPAESATVVTFKDGYKFCSACGAFGYSGG